MLTVAVVGVLLVARTFGTDTHGARVVRFSIDSRLVHRTLPVTAVISAGSSKKRPPLLVFLHGKGEDQDSNLNDAMFAALARLGSRAPDVVFPTAALTPTGITEQAGRGARTCSGR
jgi:hypothetical protein